MSICTCAQTNWKCEACDKQAAKAQEQQATKVCTCEVINSINVGFVPSDECFGCDEEEN
jgi:hypothetical protein